MCISVTTGAQILPGARQTAVEHSAIAYAFDVMSIYDNPALLSEIIQPEAAIAYSPAPFGLTELKTASAAASFYAFREQFSVSVTAYGFELYNTIHAGLTYSYRVTPDFAAGLTAGTKSITIKNYGSATAFIPTAGFYYRYSNAVALGVSIQNFTHSTIGRSNTPLPVVYATGICVNEDNLHVFASLEKETGALMAAHAGSSYAINTNFALAVGYNSNPQQMSFGVTFSYQPVSFAYTLSNNPDLGYTHQLGLFFTY